MKSPHMAAITDSLEQSFRSFSINHRLASASGAAAAAAAAAPSAAVRRSPTPATSSDDEQRRQQHHHHPHHQHHPFDTTLELNSHISLPPFWEQCLDLKTGEVYYRNCRTGMRVKEDPRISEAHSRESYSDEDGDDDESSSDGGSEESCCSSPYGGGGGGRQQYPAENEAEVLVVAGCKRCFMYFMVPKQVEDCPKCSTSRLVHFDRSDDSSNGFA